MTFKIINNSIDFNELMFTLFVFDVYFCMIELNAFFSILTQRAAAMRKIINEIKRLIVSRQMSDVFNTRNEFSTIAIHDFSLNSSVLMFWKNVANHANTWQKSYNLLKMKKKINNHRISKRINEIQNHFNQIILSNQTRVWWQRKKFNFRRFKSNQSKWHRCDQTK